MALAGGLRFVGHRCELCSLAAFLAMVDGPLGFEATQLGGYLNYETY